MLVDYDNEPRSSSCQRKKQVTDDVRMMIINQSKKCISNTQIAKDFGLPRTTVVSIVTAHSKTGRIEASKRGGDFSSKLSLEHKTHIRNWVDEDATVTLKALSNKILDKFGIKVSLSTINRCLKEFHYSLKSLTIVPERKNAESTLEQRFLYAQTFNTKMLQTDDKNFIFIDEAGFSISCSTQSGRSLTGTSAYVRVGAVRSKNVSVIAAMNKYGMIFHKINYRPVNGEDLKCYLLELVKTCNEGGIDSPCFILDNARIHHYNGLHDIVQQLELTLFYLPPYSPFLNPIENCFSKWKNFVVRSQSRNEAELLNYIGEGFRTITSTDCGGYYKKMLGYIVRCLNNEIILE